MEKLKEEYDAMMICREKVAQRGLPMQIVDAEYQWDRRKLTFYFKADKRVDFRELTKENFRIFKVSLLSGSCRVRKCPQLTCAYSHVSGCPWFPRTTRAYKRREDKMTNHENKSPQPRAQSVDFSPNKTCFSSPRLPPPFSRLCLSATTPRGWAAVAKTDAHTTTKIRNSIFPRRNNQPTDHQLDPRKAHSSHLFFARPFLKSRCAFNGSYLDPVPRRLDGETVV